MTTVPPPDPDAMAAALAVDPHALWVLPSQAVPLSTRAGELVGKGGVTVHITGGMSVEGVIDALEDDLTLIVTDGRRRYDIALSSVAVIESLR